MGLNKHLLARNGYTLITSSAWNNSQNAATGGVGFLLSSRALKSCFSIVSHNDRTMEITLHGNPMTTALCCYSPHNELPEEDVPQFYHELSTVIYAIPAHNLLIIGGDMNAQLGPPDALFTCANDTNRNGKYMKDFMEQHNLIVTNTRFQNTKNKLWTHCRPNGQLVQLDFILARKKWINSFKNSRAYNSFEGIGSDHRIVSCKCQISYRKNKARSTNPLKGTDWKSIARDKKLCDQFTVAVHNRFCILRDELEDDSSTSAVYDALITANKETAIAMLPKKSKNIVAVASSGKVNSARETLKKASMKHNTRPTRETHRRLESAKAAFDQAYSDALETMVKTKTDDLNRLHEENKHAQAWKVLREITDKKSSPVNRIKGNTAEERQDCWFRHFSNLLGGPEQNIDTEDPFFNQKVCDNLPIKTGPFSMEELLTCLTKLKSSKTPGPDNIPAFIWKCPLFHQELLDFCNDTYVGNKPDAFSQSAIIPLPKKGDLSLPSNYRGITLSPIAAKIYNSMLLNRITPHLDPVLRRNQNGFRKGRATTPQILALRRIIEEFKISKQKASIVFVDFTKAFDSVNRKVALHILRNYGFPEETVQAIAIMYNNPTSYVQSADGPTKEFVTTAGILQGDTLAPYLFVITVDYILRQSVDTIKEKGIVIKPGKSNRDRFKYLTDLDYADDIALTGTLLKDAQDLLTSLENASARVGLFF